MPRMHQALSDRPNIPANPTVTVVILLFNRRDELRRTLREMMVVSDYDAVLVDFIVVDNASDDGSAEIVQAEFPEVHLIRREVNCGISAWNDGFEAATGDLVLVLDDDCYLPADGLRRAVAAMREQQADLVSFAVAAFSDPSHRFDRAYRTGLLTFWGCAALVRRDVLEELGGFEPEIFIWAHEVEFMMRFFDRGFRHLHLPEVIAVHMKEPGVPHPGAVRLNARNFSFVAAKHLRARDAVVVLLALMASSLRHAIRLRVVFFAVVRETIAGFVRGIRHRDPLNSAEVSEVYRRHFNSYSFPWHMMRSPGELVRPLDPRNPSRGLVQYYERRARYYPDHAATLQFQDGSARRSGDVPAELHRSMSHR